MSDAAGTGPTQADVLRVVCVSPSDVSEERAAMQPVVNELNRTIAQSLGLRLDLWRWETGTRPGLHREGAQGVIDRDMRIADADVVIGIFWRRFGTAGADGQSGTAGELRDAWEAWETSGRRRPDVMLYFSRRSGPHLQRSELDQLQRLFDFRETIPDEQLWAEYGAPSEFSSLVREHLTRFVLALRGNPADRAQPSLASGEPRKVRFNLPPVRRFFEGRETELEALDAAFSIVANRIVTVPITGPGGIGKSELAAYYVESRADLYDVIAWISAKDGGIANFAELAGELALPVDDLYPDQRAESARRWLSRFDGRWLLVVDDLAHADQLSAMLPSAGNGHVLVTSRDRRLDYTYTPINLTVFDQDTAIKYLVERTGIENEEVAARALADALGCLPLALSHAAAYCEGGRTTFDLYRGMLGALPAAEFFHANPGASHAITVASTWRPSIEAATKAVPMAPDVLAVAAYLSPGGIPKTLFEGLLEDPSDPRQMKQLHDAFAVLDRYCLADFDAESLWVHQLIQKTVRDEFRERDDQTAWLRALRVVDAAFPTYPALRATWADAARLLPHVLEVADGVISDSDSAAQAVRLLNRAGLYLNWDERGQRALEIAEKTARDAEMLLGTEHPATLAARDTLGYVNWTIGRLDVALPIQRSVLEDRERILGPEHADTLTAANHLAYSYWTLGDTDKSVPLQERVVAGREDLLGSDDPETLVARHELSMSYRTAGRLEEAIAIQEQVLAARERLLGPDDPHTIRSRLERALSYRDEGRIEEAINLMLRVVAEREAVLGIDHPHTLYARHELALMYHDAHRPGDGMRLQESVIADRERVLGHDHPDTTVALEALAKSYRAWGDDERTPL